MGLSFNHGTVNARGRITKTDKPKVLRQSCSRLITKAVEESIAVKKRLLEDGVMLNAIQDTAVEIVSTLRTGGKVLFCGNGGSAADAQHLAGEFLCRFYRDRRPMAAVALSTDTSVLTAIANDYAFDEVFSRQVRALGKKGDMLMAISTSGRSPNVLLALQAAREKHIKTVLLTGSIGNDLNGLADIVLRATSVDTPRIQELHLLVEHIVCEIVESALYEDA